MSLPSSTPPPPSPASRLMRGYGPLLAFAVLFLLMAALVPTVGHEIKTVAVAGPGGGAPASPGATAGDGSPEGTDAYAPDGTTDGGGVTTGSGPAAARGAGANRRGTGGGTGTGAGGGAAAGTGGSAAGGKSAAAPRIGACGTRKAQVPNDPYSPPCIAFSGDNGGATYKGVTPTEITISARLAGLPDFSAAPGDSGPAATFSIKPEEIKRTIEGLGEYFNSRFQFYGRKLKIVFFDGKGSFTTELQGGGQEQVEADAVKAAEEIKAFAEIIAISAPYTDALARRGLLSFGAPFMSAEWMAARRPYAWSPTVDCTFLQQSVSDYVNKRLAGKNAKYAAGDLKGKPRSFAVLAPENPWYQQCVDAGEKVAKAAGPP